MEQLSIPGLERVYDQKLEKEVSNLILKLLANNKTSASNIHFGFFENMLPIGHLLIGPEGHLIFINIKAKEMIKDRVGRQILNATLAHEIGHIVDTKKNDYYFDESLSFRLEAEVRADRMALIMLRNIYKHPEEPLAKQIKFAMNTMLSLDNADPDKLDLAKKIFKKRKEALGIDLS
jgi:hypothetical protein